MVLVYMSAILRERDTKRRVFVEEFHTQRDYWPIEHLSVAEDWSYIIPQITFDLTYYDEKLEARAASEEERQEWERQHPGQNAYYCWCDDDMVCN